MDEDKTQSLSIEYALTRGEIFRAFLQSAAGSPRYLLTIILNSVTFGVITLLFRAAPLARLTMRDAISALTWTLGLLLLMPLWIFIRAKTDRRTLTISRDGITTEIGRHNGKVPWPKVKIITETPRFVLIARTNGNAFFIPDRAFSGVDQRQHFVTEIRRWMTAHT